MLSRLDNITVFKILNAAEGNFQTTAAIGG